MELWSRILGRSNAHAVNMKSVMKLEEFHAVESLFWSLDYCIGSCPIICHLHWSCIISFLIDFVVSIRLCCFFFCPESVADCSTNDFGRWIGAPSHLAANPSLSTSEKAYHSRWQWREATYEATSWHSSQPANKSERYIYIYLEPKLGPFVLLEKGLPCFGGVTIKNRDCLGARYIVVHLGVSCNFPPPWHGSQCLGNVLKKGTSCPRQKCI